MSSPIVSGPGNGSGTEYYYYDPVLLSQLSLALDLYIPPIIFIIGYVGNSLTVLIMSNRCFVKFSTCQYLLAIAVLDILIQSMFVLNWLEVNFSLFSSSRGLVNILCRVCGFFLMTFVYISAWATVAMTVDRFMAVYRPISRRVGKPKTRTVFLCLSVIAALISLPNFGYKIHNVNDAGNDLRCSLSHDSVVGRIFAWVEFSLSTVGPAIILISLNSAIINRIRLNRDASTVTPTPSVTSSQTNVNTTTLRRTVSANTKAPKSLNVLLIIASLSFLLLNLPYRLYKIHWHVKTELTSDDDEFIRSSNPGLDTAIYRLIKYLWYLSHSSNFYMYVLGGGGRFRYQLAKSLKCVKGGPNSNSLE